MSISLSSLRSARACEAPRIGIYGRPGVGKTTLAATAPSPVFLLTEEGLGVITPTPKHTPLCRTYRDVREWIEALRTEPHDYATLVIDSLDGLEPLMVEYVASRDGKTAEDFNLGKHNFGYGKGSLRLASEMGDLLEALDRLREDKNMAIVLLAHDKVKRFEAPDVESYDKYQLAIDEKVAVRVTAWLDTLAYAHYRVSTTKGQDGKVRGVGAGERLLSTEDLPSRLAKRRYNVAREISMDYAAKVGMVSALTLPVAT